MKKIFTLLFVIAAVAVSAQSISFTYNGTPLANGDTITTVFIRADIGDMIFVPRVGYAYNGTEPAEVRAYKSNIQVNPEDMIAFCIGVQCVEDTSAMYTLNAGEVIAENDERAFHMNFLPSAEGSTLVKITFENLSGNADLSSFYIRYISEGVGVNEHVATTLNAYPNPATSGVTIEYSGVQENAVVILQNLTGSVVAKQNVGTSGKTYINTSSLKAGVYFYGIQENGRMTNVKKLVVK